jgi:putative endopeptidase
VAKLCSILLAALIAFSCQKPEMKSGIDASIMDKNVRPQADLYRYMNGSWLAKYEIPADRSNFGMFTKLADDAEKNLRTIIEEAGSAKDRPAGSPQQKVGDVYASFMDSATIEAQGISPIKADLAACQDLKSKEDIVRLAAAMGRQGVFGPFVFFVDQDEKNSTRYIVNVYQTGLSLPDREYYLRDDPRFKNFREQLTAHMEKMFTLAGYADAKGMASRTMGVEMQIARRHWSQVENRDRDKTYNKMALTELTAMTPTFNWTLFAREAGFGSQESVRVFQPTYIRGLKEVFAGVPLADWKDYYAWRVLTSSAPYLSSAFVNENFSFFGRTLTGVEELRPRWKRGVSAVEETMGELVGRMYVERYFKPEAKQRMVQLVANLRAAYAERIKGLEWMSAETKQKALDKLAKFNAKIGYPDKWRDYSSMDIVKGDLVGNMRRAAAFEYQRQLDKLGRPIDRSEWFMTPQTVNAYYNATMNEVVFPAAILQPPFFNVDADDAVNYGGIGAVIGHEMTHGFDDQGRKSDGDGNLTDWWTDSDGKEFERRSGLMVDQYGRFNPIDTMKVNGQLTLGENIADLGGLTISYHAYQRSLAGKDSPVIDGLAGSQRFFLGWAQVWARKYRDDELRRRLLTDPHSPSEYRANGIVANMPEFYAAFDVKEGDPLFRSPSERVNIW